MFRTLVKTERWRSRTRRCRCGISNCGPCAGSGGTARKSCSAPGDQIILDDDSVLNLEARADRLVPATLYSRMLASERRLTSQASSR